MNLQFFKQKSEWDCSLSCLAMVHYYFFNQKTIFNTLFYETKYCQGLNLLQLETLALKYQIKLESFATDWETMLQLKFNKPLIMPTQINNQQHYIVIFKKRWGKFLIGDPNQTSFEWWSKDKLQKIFQNIIVFSQQNVNQKQLLKPKKITTKLNWTLINFWTIGFFCSLIVIVLNLSIQFGIKLLIEMMLIQNNLNVGAQLILGIVLLFVSQIIVQVFWEIKMAILRFYHRKNRNQLFFGCLKNLSWQQFKKHSETGIWRKFQFFQIIDEYQIETGLNSIKNLLMMIGSFGILLLFDLWIIVPVLGIVIVYWVLNLLLWPKQQQILHKTHRFEYHLNEQMMKDLNNWKDWKGRLLWDKKIINLHQKMNQKNQLYYRNTWYELFQQITFQNVTFGSQIILLYFLQLVRQNNQQLGSLLFVLTLANNIFSSAQYFFHIWMQNKKIKWLKNDVEPFFLWNKTNPKNKILPVKKWRNCQFVELNYSHNDFQNVWRKNLNSDFNQALLLLGKNGSGKSTLLNLFFNHELKYFGKIIINESEFKRIQKQVLPTVIYLTSDSKILQRTVAENIFIYQKRETMPNSILKWMELVLSKNGLNWNTDLKVHLLSSGQKQMIVFLSLFNSSGQIFLLDECLNSVGKDLKLELIVQFLNYQNQKLILYASHDQNLIRLFPKQLNLNDYI